MLNRLTAVLFALTVSICVSGVMAESAHVTKPRIIISTDIGGTDPDDNQSIIHLMMYSDCFDIEGLVSSPSFGDGSVNELLREIDVYEKGFPVLKKYYAGLMTPDDLRKLSKQGRKGLAPYEGFGSSTEGSEWIVKCARKESDRPLYVLVWGTLEDVAQALHDAPDIKDRIRVYFIGGPNKKWGVNSYTYIAKNFPDLWMIENNATYRGLISNGKNDDGYYDKHIAGAGHMGTDFKNYYDGRVKMGDTPSLLYMMNGDPNDPTGESWGGSFERISESPYTIFDRDTNERDSVAPYSVVEYRFTGPKVSDDNIGKEFFTFRIDRQDWPGVYIGNGNYAVRYSPKQPAKLSYETFSDIEELNGHKGELTVTTIWPGGKTPDGITLGNNWFTDRQDPNLFEGPWQGSLTVRKFRKEVLDNWSERWSRLK